jgi:hypothetical protein
MLLDAGASLNKRDPGDMRAGGARLPLASM